MSSLYKKFRLMSLVAAEAFDTWRIMPRLMLLAYAVLVSNLYLWYKSIPTYVQEQCDAATLQIFLNNKVPIDQAIKLSCTVKDVVGGPTPAQTTLVTTIMGLTSVVFGFYTASGRKWDSGLPGDVADDPAQPRSPFRRREPEVPEIPEFPPPTPTMAEATNGVT